MSRNTIAVTGIGFCIAAFTATATIGAMAVSEMARPRQTPAQIKASDNILEDRIQFKLETDDVTRKYDIDVEVETGMATLTGEVATAAQRSAAEKIAKIDGVSKVTNKIEVDPDADKTLAERTKKGLNKAGEAITDAWITTKVHWFFTGEDLLDDSDIDVDTNGGVVTLKGTVKTAAGKARAELLTKQTDGVKRVVNELKIGS
jgi:osmotically-inducible protein OsmY